MELGIGDEVLFILPANCVLEPKEEGSSPKEGKGKIIDSCDYGGFRTFDIQLESGKTLPEVNEVHIIQKID